MTEVVNLDLVQLLTTMPRPLSHLSRLPTPCTLRDRRQRNITALSFNQILVEFSYPDRDRAGGTGLFQITSGLRGLAERADDDERRSLR